MKNIVEAINFNTEWLYFKLYENAFFFFDFWSIMHFLTGMLLLLLLEKFFTTKKWRVMVFLLFIYEVIEISIRYIALNIFLPETIKDQFTDMLVGMTGGVLSYGLLNLAYNKKVQNPTSKLDENLIMLICSFSIAFIWVGFYGYKYSHEFFNSKGINYTAFLLWWSGLFIVGKIYSALKFYTNKNIHSFVLSFGFYFFGLCSLEYFFYHILGVHEIGASEHKPMLFDIIHGTKAMHAFYVSAPFLFILHLEGVLNLVKSIMKARLVKITKTAHVTFPQKLQPE